MASTDDDPKFPTKLVVVLLGVIGVAGSIGGVYADLQSDNRVQDEKITQIKDEQAESKQTNKVILEVLQKLDRSIIVIKFKLGIPTE